MAQRGRHKNGCGKDFECPTGKHGTTFNIVLDAKKPDINLEEE